MTERELRAAGVRVQRAAERLGVEVARRDGLVRAARGEGWSHGRVARVLGVSRARAAQIARSSPVD